MHRNRSTAPPGAGELNKQFEFIRELGRGGSAVVYLAHDRELQRDVAIKLIRSPLAKDEETVARFAREAKAAARLHHPNIVAVHAVHRLRDGTLALVMQYVPGRTLKEAVLADGAFAYGRAERVLREIGAALAHAHQHAIVHRDVKPENIFLHRETGAALLADFGIARMGDAGSGITVGDVALGTPAYMAPEQIDGSAVDPRSDLYSLASVGWEMLTGEAPWEGENLYGVIYKQKHDSLAPLRSFRPDIPARLGRTIERGLAKQPGHRFPDARAMLAALDGADGPDLLDRLRTRFAAAAATAQGYLPRAAPQPQPADATDTAFDASTIRFRRGATEPPGETLERPTPTGPAGAGPAVGPGLANRGLRYAAMSAGLLLVTGLGATLAALNRTADQALPGGATTELSADSVITVGPAPLALATSAPVAPAAEAADLPTAAMVEPASVDRQEASAEVSAAPEPASAAAAEPGASTASATEERPAPVREEARFATAPGIVAGGLHTCAVTAQGELFCWGGNGSGQVGDGGQARNPAPARVRTDQAFREVAAGLAHSCGIAADGRLFCWGSNDSGQLGDGSTLARSAPRAVVGSRRFASVVAGSSHSCGVTTGGELFCWGGNGSGQLGDGATARRTAPVRVPGGRFTAVAVGWNHTCGLDPQGHALCWGANGEGQLGTDDRTSRHAPAAVVGGDSFRRLAAGGGHTCGITTAGQLFCWGANTHGQLGDGTTTAQARPTAVDGGTGFSAVTAGGVHTCGLQTGGQAFCWGRNMYGQLGDGSRTDRSAPVAVAGGHRFASIHASGSHTCGITHHGERFCWGYNVEGQLGDGTRTHQATPVRVPATGT